MLSYLENIPTILDAVKKTGARKILDVGGGMGKYAILIRENDLSSRTEKGEIIPVNDLIIDCCEDTKYFTEMKHHDGLYDNHFHKSVFELPFKNDYDLILFIDTVEHWNKEETKELFKKLNGKKLISTPKNTVMYKEEFYGDPRHHQSQWNKEDFNGKDFSTPLSYIYIEDLKTITQ